MPAEQSRGEYLRAIAEQMRQVWELFADKTIRSIDDAEKMAGKLFANAVAAGAFSDVRFALMRTLVDENLQNGHCSVAFSNTAYWLRGKKWITGDTRKALESD